MSGSPHAVLAGVKFSIAFACLKAAAAALMAACGSTTVEGSVRVPDAPCARIAGARHPASMRSGTATNATSRRVRIAHLLLTRRRVIFPAEARQSVLAIHFIRYNAACPPIRAVEDRSAPDR